MISFSKIGELGRLGNQLFQYSYLRSQANRMGVHYACPAWDGDTLFDLKENNRVFSDLACNQQYREPKENCGFNLAATQISDDTDVWGFFQTSKYFSDEPLAWFNFSQDKIEQELSQFVGVHLRFGDYTELKHVYTSLTKHYYRRAMSKFPNARFMVFSDDLNQAKALLGDYKKAQISYYSGNSDLDDFFGLTSCYGHIIGNSSFSWWAAYLSQNRSNSSALVVYPNAWFYKQWITQNYDIGMTEWLPVSHKRFEFFNLDKRKLR